MFIVGKQLKFGDSLNGLWNYKGLKLSFFASCLSHFD